MEMVFTTQESMDKAIEAIIEKKVQAYKSDWTDYDRPKYEACKRDSKNCIFIARDCGTELYSMEVLLSGDDGYRCSLDRFGYYVNQDRDNEYYYLDVKDLRIRELTKDEVELIYRICEDRF